MNQEPEKKTCKTCGMDIPTAAKKCPHCHHWQRWVNFSNPQFNVVLFIIPLFILYGVMMDVMFKPFREWEQFSQHTEQVKILEDKLEFGGDQDSPAVIVIGKVKNSSPVDWKDVRFQVEFFNTEGSLFDAGQQENYTYRLPAGQECPFKVSFHRQFPEKDYASYKVRIISAVDSRKQF